MRAIPLMLFLMALAGPAHAEWRFALDSAQVRSGDGVRLRVEDSDFQCFPAGVPEVLREGATVRVRYELEDFLPAGTSPGTCPGYRVTPRFDALGSFAPGQYLVEVRTCGNPPSGPSCTLRAALNRGVFGANERRFTVPALADPVALGLVLALAAVGLVTVRVRRG